MVNNLFTRGGGKEVGPNTTDEIMYENKDLIDKLK